MFCSLLANLMHIMLISFPPQHVDYWLFLKIKLLKVREASVLFNLIHLARDRHA